MLLGILVLLHVAGGLEETTVRGENYGKVSLSLSPGVICFHLSVVVCSKLTLYSHLEGLVERVEF